MIGIVNYGSGNIRAIANIYKRLNIKSKIVNSEPELQGVTKLILPGVGAFDEIMMQLSNSGMMHEINRLVMENNMPVLGVCVGMQVMAMCSEEGELNGLGWFDAVVKKFDKDELKYKPKLPHMGWNVARPVKQHSIFDSVAIERGFYFLHSYYFSCENSEDVLSVTNYGIEYASSINKENIFGFQFHPEKSHSNGVSIFKNFSDV